MDRKTRKRMKVLSQKLQNRQQRLVGAREQPDQPGELEQLEGEITAIREELKKLREN